MISTKVNPLDLFFIHEENKRNKTQIQSKIEMKRYTFNAYSLLEPVV